MTRKIYAPGSELAASELNDIQDSYIDGAYTPWTPFGNASFYVHQDSVARPQYAKPGAPDVSQGAVYYDGTTFFGVNAGYLDILDYPSGYADSFRDVHLRFVAMVNTTRNPINDLLVGVSLREIIPSTSSYFFGPETGELEFPSITNELQTIRFEGSPFLFPPAGLYVIELKPRTMAGWDVLRGAMVNVALQRRTV